MREVEIPVEPEPRRPFFTVKGLARYLSLEERTIRNLLAGSDPEIPSYTFGRARRINAEDVDAYIARSYDQRRAA